MQTVADRATARLNEIRAHPLNSVPSPLPDRFETWRRVWVPTGDVDLVEAYVTSVLEPLGVGVHFLDAWSYHLKEGEVHCGTNVKRAPYAEPWWNHYDPRDDVRYHVHV